MRGGQPTEVKSYGQGRAIQWSAAGEEKPGAEPTRRFSKRQRDRANKRARIATTAITAVTEDASFHDLVREHLINDTYHKRNRLLVERGAGLLYLGRLLYVPVPLRKHILEEMHNTNYGGHLGVDKTTAAIQQDFGGHTCARQ